MLKGGGGSQSVDRSEIHHYDVIPDIRLQSETEESNTWHCSFEGCGNIFNLVLESNERLIADLPHSQRKQLQNKCNLFRGSIDGAPDSWVRLCKTGKKWSGMMWDGKELYILDPIRSIRHALKKRPHLRTSGTVIYKLSDVVHLDKQACGVGSSAMSDQSSDDYQSLVERLKELVPLAAEGASLNLDMSVVTDPLFSQIQEGNFGTPAQVAVAARINVVDGIYSEQVGIQIRLVDVIELGTNGLLTSSSASTLLSQFRNFVGSSVNNPGITHLFTGRELNGSVIGIAFVGTLCNQSSGVGVDQIRGGGTSGALLVAHELGHNFGAPHDNQGGSPCAGTAGNFIMNPFLNGSDQFSQCSIDQMQPTINSASCLTDINANRAPTVTITEPKEGEFLSVDTQVNFVGSATDPEDGDLGATISWSSDLDGTLGTGGNISVTLSEGTHLVTASVTDSGGLDASDTIQAVVIDDGGGVVILESDFDINEEGFVFVDDAFRNTAEPAYSEGTHLSSGGFNEGALEVVVGNIDNADIFGMSGGWRQTIVLDTAQEITMNFLYNLIQAADYESDEFGQALLAVDGSLVTLGSNDFLAQITGDGNGGAVQTTGWVPIVVNVGVLSEGSHTITIGVFNNKKTFNNESTRLLIDELTVRGESGTTPFPPTPAIIIESHFDADEEGFVLEEDSFRNTSNPEFASGSYLPTGGFNGGGLQVLLGNTNNADILGMSGGWSRSFSLDAPQRVSLSFRYNLVQAANYETDEFSEALLALDGVPVIANGNEFLARITGNGNGGPAQTSGWVEVNLDLGTLIGDHTITIGTFNNKKTYFDESTEIFIDDVILQ